jgi:hypothetical protein
MRQVCLIGRCLPALYAALILAVLVGAPLLFLAWSATAPRAELATLQLAGEYRKVRGKRITVYKDTEVRVYIKLKYNLAEETTGTLKVEVKKDKVMSPDVVHKVLEKSVTLPAGSGETDWIDMGTFVADEVTGNGIGQTRQYFIKVYWNDECIHDPTDPNTREAVFVVETEVAYSVGEFEGVGPRGLS